MTSARISLQAAAEKLGVSVDTVRRRIADGSLTAYRVGPRLLRVDSDDVDALATPVPTAEGRPA
jgi:excisionase family DNA binding protein